MNKKFLPALAVYGIILALFSILFFVAPFKKVPVTIVSYVFVVVEILFSMFLTYLCYKSGDNLVSRVYGFPIFRVGAIASVTQFVFSLIVFVIAFFVEIPMWIVVVVSLLILGFAGIGSIATISTKKIIELQEKEVIEQIRQVTTFRIDVENAVSLCDDGELKKAVSKLAEDFRYSDPVSSPATAEIEGRISMALSELEALIPSDKAAALDKTAEISRMLADRNRKCKAMKGI